MTHTTRGLALVALAGSLTLLVGCGGSTEAPAPAPTATAAPAAPSAPAPTAPEAAATAPAGDATATTAAAPSQAAIDEAASIFATRCTPCHGTDGKGDGAAAAALNPKPRNYQDAAWQVTVSDQEIETAILKGGAAVGKSPLMPANPDLEGKPEVVTALRLKVRSFAPAAAAGASAPAPATTTTP